jgi:uncharacterized membrane protein
MSLRLAGLPRIWLRTIVAGLMAAGILHVLITFAWPTLRGREAFAGIKAITQVNQMRLLPPTSTKTQVLPFQSPDMRYALCRFDASDSAIVVRASLPEPGWIFSIHSPAGETVYVITGQEQKRTDVALLLLPPGDRFLGVLPEARIGSGLSQLQLGIKEGTIMLRAPSKGPAFNAEIDAELIKASCLPRRA